MSPIHPEAVPASSTTSSAARLLAAILVLGGAAPWTVGQVVFGSGSALPGPSLVFSPASLEAVDLDDDGDLDLVVASGHDLVLLRNDGVGTFDPLPALVGHAPVVVADVDEDGVPDLVHAISQGAFRYAWTRGLGGLAFASPVPILQTTATEFPAQLDVGDVDGDGHIDLVARSAIVFTDEMTVLRGDGAGGFTIALQTVGTLVECSLLTDLDGDGLDDLVLKSQQGPVRWAQALGGGAFSAVTTLGSLPRRLLDARNLFGDARVELLLTDPGTGGLFEVMRLQAGALVSVQIVDPPGSDGSAANGVALGDFVGNARPELAVSWSGSVVCFALGDSTLEHVGFANLPGHGLGLAAGDLDGDGRDDLATLQLGDPPWFVPNLQYPAGSPFRDLGRAVPTATGFPQQIGSGALGHGEQVVVTLEHAPPASAAWLVAGPVARLTPFGEGGVLSHPALALGPVVTDPHGRAQLTQANVGGPGGIDALLQWWIADASVPAGISASTVMRIQSP